MRLSRLSAMVRNYRREERVDRLLGGGDYEGALGLCDRYATCKSPYIFYWLEKKGRICMEAGLPEHAEECFRDALGSRGSDVVTAGLFADSLARQGKTDEAAAFLEDCMDESWGFSTEETETIQEKIIGERKAAGFRPAASPCP